MDKKDTQNLLDLDDRKLSFDPIDSAHPNDCFYSDYVVELITKVFTVDESFPTLPQNVINSDLTLNLDVLDSALDHLLSQTDLSYDGNNIEQINHYLKRIGPLFEIVFNKFDSVVQLDKTGQSLLSVIEPNLYWTGDWKRYFVNSVEISLDRQTDWFTRSELKPGESQIIRNIISLCTITSGLEQTLGNLNLTQSHFVPPLLKTLLTTPELEKLIGYPLIRLLKVVVGPPFTINLRNILWHGFVNCSERIYNPFNDCFVELNLLRFFYFLLSISITIGAVLQQESVLNKLSISMSSEIKTQIVKKIPQRKLISFDEFSSKLESTFLNANLEMFTFDFIRSLIDQSPLIHRTFQPLWKAAFELLFHEQNPYRNFSFMLLMPLLESSLRYLFCSLNQLSNRLLTAICKEYYVTFTEILSFDAIIDGSEVRDTTNPTQMNQLYRQLPRPLLILLLDIILLPKGLRFRDRLSHGQIELHNINPVVRNSVICSVIAVLQSVNWRWTGSVNRQSQISPAIAQIVRKCATDYECQYHSIYLLKSQTLSLMAQLYTLIDLYETHVLSDEKESDSAKHHWRTHLDECIGQIGAVNYCLSKPFIPECDALATLLRNCLTNYKCFVANLCAFMEIRSEELRQSKLRSRQRANYQTMLKCLPIFVQSLCVRDTGFCDLFVQVLASLERVVYLFGGFEASNKNNLEKMFKHLLKIAENLAQQSSIKENRWDIISILCAEQTTLVKVIHSKIQNPM